jgi:signal transduction histidine kinase
MPICVRIAEAHGSKLEISKSPSLGGAQFSFILPITQAKGEEA